MTNEQFKIMLEYQHGLLKEALEKSVELMPLTADREMEWNYIGKDRNKYVMASIAVSGIAVGYENNPNYEEQPTGRYLALIPLYDCLDVLGGQIEEIIK